MNYRNALNLFSQALDSGLKDMSTSVNRADTTKMTEALLGVAKNLLGKLEPVRRRIPQTYKSLNIACNALVDLHAAIQDRNVKAVVFRGSVAAARKIALVRFINAIEQESNTIDNLNSESEPAAKVEQEPTEVDTSVLSQKFKVTSPIKLKSGTKPVRPKPLTTDDIDMPTRVELNQREADLDDIRRQKRQEEFRKREEQAFDELEKIDSGKPKLPSKVNGPFSLAYYPVIPVLKNEFAIDELVALLKARGVKSHSFGGYLTLDKQTLLVINTAWLKANKIKTKPELYAEQALERINSNTSKAAQLRLMSSKSRPNPENPELKLFWVMPERRVPQRLAPSKITDWDILRERDEDENNYDLDRLRKAEEASTQMLAQRKEAARLALKEEQRKHAERTALIEEKRRASFKNKNKNKVLSPVQLKAKAKFLGE